MKKTNNILPRYSSSVNDGYGNSPLIIDGVIPSYYIGMEIELASSLTKKDVDDLFSSNIELQGVYCLSHDGTITTCSANPNRIEITLAPAPAAIQKKRCIAISNILTGKARAYNRGGIHITYMDTSAIFANRALQLMLSTDSVDFATFFNRTKTSYCSDYVYTFSKNAEFFLGFKRSLQKLDAAPRGAKALVIVKKYGVEIRGFNSNLKKERLFEAIDKSKFIAKTIKNAKSISDLNFTTMVTNYNNLLNK